MFFMTLDPDFWFCEQIHSGPCSLIYRATFDRAYPFRIVTLVSIFLLLIVTEILYLVLCTFCPCLIRLRFPDAFSSYPEDDDYLYDKCSMDREQDLAVLRKKMAAGHFDYHQWRDHNAKKGVDSTYDCCSICLHNYSEEDEVVGSSFCQHVFHEECLVLWLDRKASCPCCRQELLAH